MLRPVGAAGGSSVGEIQLPGLASAQELGITPLFLGKRGEKPGCGRPGVHYLLRSKRCDLRAFYSYHSSPKERTQLVLKLVGCLMLYGAFNLL